VGHAAHMGKVINAYKILVQKPVGRSKHRWKGNIRMGLTEIEWRVVYWIETMAWCCEHSNEPSGFIDRQRNS